jgi:hypothetical protein
MSWKNNNGFFFQQVRFIKAFRVADQENETRKRLEAAAREAAINGNSPQQQQQVAAKNKLNQKKQQVSHGEKGLREEILTILANWQLFKGFFLSALEQAQVLTMVDCGSDNET